MENEHKKLIDALKKNYQEPKKTNKDNYAHETTLPREEFIDFFNRNKSYILDQFKRLLSRKGITSIFIVDVVLEETGLPEEIEYGSYIPIVISYKVNEAAILSIFNYTMVPTDEQNNMFICKLHRL